jgi:PAS domain S-box-containing protein
MLLIDPGTGAIIDANLSAEKFYGFPHTTLLTMNIADINTLSHDDIRSEMRQAEEQQRNYFIFKHKVANGSIRTVEVYSSPITMQDKALLFSIIHDITDRKLAEEAIRDLEHQLFHSQKLESLARMSGGIAHDFNNLLQVVVGNLDVTLMKLPPDAPVRSYIGEGIRAAERAAELSRMMLAYSGKGYLFTKELNLTRLVEESSAMLSAVVPSAISFEFKLDPAIPFVTADAGKLLEVIVNMVSNAAEAIGEAAGLITLSTGVRDFEQAVLNTSRFEEKLAEGRYVWLEVHDTGCGMDGDTAYKLFDPFFTTKFTGRGLGMSAAYGIIRAHKGAFLVESKLGYGTTILFLLPIAGHLDEQADHPVAVEAVPNHIHGPRTILIVDDEEMIRSVSTAMLGECGFETIEAADGEEALRIFREQGDRIDLVLLDACMPQMDGLMVFKELRRIRPEIKVLLATGYSKQQVAAQFSGLGLNGFIQKPFTLDRLSDGVRRVLKA